MHKDLKEGLSSNRKADITHVRVPFMNYTARPCEYGEVKYERSNFLRSTGGVAHKVPTADDFKRFRKYLRAAASHIAETLDAMEKHQATDPQLEDVAGMKRAAYAVDTDITPESKVGPSLLPHVAPACSSLNMAITQAVECGLLPRDPGAAWERGEVPGVITKAEVTELVFFATPLKPADNSLFVEVDGRHVRVAPPAPYAGLPDDPSKLRDDPPKTSDVDGGRYYADRAGDVKGKRELPL